MITIYAVIVKTCIPYSIPHKCHVAQQDQSSDAGTE